MILGGKGGGPGRVDAGCQGSGPALLTQKWVKALAAGSVWGQREAEQAELAFRCTHGHASFRLSSDRKENPLEERHGSFLAPTQILSAAVLHLRSLSAVSSPYHLPKSSRKGAGFFARLPQPDQEEITFDLLSQSEQEILLWPGLDEYA